MTAMLHINYVTNFSVGQFQIRKFQTTFFNRRPCHMPIYDIIEIITYFIIIIGSEERVGAIFLFFCIKIHNISAKFQVGTILWL